MLPTTKKVLMWIGGLGAMAATNMKTRSGLLAYRLEQNAAHSQFLASSLVGQHLCSKCFSVRSRFMAFFGLVR
jgi:hypothetical protein